MNNFDFNQKIFSGLALIFIFVLSFAVALFSVSVGENIVQNTAQSSVFQSVR